jgi:putative endonuclease
MHLRKLKKKWQVYILECKNGFLYTGMTTDIERRYKEHCRGSSRYTSYNPPVQIVYTENQPDRPMALKREFQIKSWTRKRKLALIAGEKAPAKRLAGKTAKRAKPAKRVKG